MVLPTLLEGLHGGAVTKLGYETLANIVLGDLIALTGRA
jgi:hypothetical protein